MYNVNKYFGFRRLIYNQPVAFSKWFQQKNKRAQRALGRSPEEKVKGQGEAIIIILLKPNIGRELLDDVIIYQIWKLWAL